MEGYTAPIHISKVHLKKKLEIQLKEKRAEVDDLNAKLKGASTDKWFTICNKRNAILGDIYTIKTKINNLRNKRPMLGYGDPLPGGTFTRGKID